jgi:hypothetical protein
VRQPPLWHLGLDLLAETWSTQIRHEAASVLAGDEAQARSVKYGRSARERLSHTHPVRLINHGGMHAEPP